MTYIIAEIGVNHNGELNLAEKLIYLAKDAGADAVKFQCFHAEQLARSDTPKTNYQLKHDLSSRSHFEMLKSLELNMTQFTYLGDLCKKLGIDFIITPYGLKDLKIITEVGIDKIKISSADLSDKSLVEASCQTGLPLIISTGMSSLEEIKRTCASIKSFENIDFSLLHCTSAYPASCESLNINAMNTLRKFSNNVGYSDHSIDGIGSFIAVSLGADILERHITIDKKLEGPDHHCSDDPKSFKNYIKQIRDIEIALGKSKKELNEVEMNMKSVSRKSGYLKYNVKKGQPVHLNDFDFQRSGGGLNEYEIYDLVLKDAVYSKDYNKCEKFLINEE